MVECGTANLKATEGKVEHPSKNTNHFWVCASKDLKWGLNEGIRTAPQFQQQCPSQQLRGAGVPTIPLPGQGVGHKVKAHSRIGLDLGKGVLREP